MNPIAKDVRTVIPIENFAACELPLPSSFETRTLKVFLQPKLGQSIWLCAADTHVDDDDNVIAIS